MMKLHDVIKVKKDIPEDNLKQGMTGVIVTIFHDPCLAYEVEFCNDKGETIIETALLPEQIESVFQPKEARTKEQFVQAAVAT